jgi:hypothetical protein
LNKNLLTTPVFRDGYGPAIGSYRIVFGGYFRGCRYHQVVEFIRDISVNGITVSVHFPDTGDLKVLPRSVIVGQTEKISWLVCWLFHPVKFPVPVERQEMAGMLLYAHDSQIAVFKGEMSDMHGFTVDRTHLLILPDGSKVLSLYAIRCE